MSEVDLVVIIAEGLPIEQAVDFLRWWFSTQRVLDPITHPSMDWYIHRHMSQISAVALRREQGA